MEKSSLKPYLIVIFLLVLTSIALAMTVTVNLTNQAGVRAFLPTQVGPWLGEEIRYCQTPDCRRAFLVSRLEDVDVCPECGGRLDGMSLAERNQLPDDTVSIKKLYVTPTGNQLHTSLVLSGKERGSIHRPEVCLVGQGRGIVGREVLSIPIEGRDPLKVMVLKLIDEARLPNGSKGPDAYSYYAYWFVGKDRETPYHLQRLAWMALDRVLHNISHRWAYIAVGGGRTDGSDDYQDVLSEFVQDFYPQIQFN